MTGSDAVNWIHGQAASFRALGSKIVQMQHRAAVGKAAATARGDAKMAADFAATIQRLGTLHNLHAAAVDKLDMINSLLEKVGAGPDALGVLPAILPVAAVALAVGLVAAMSAVIYKTNVESQRLDMAEQVLSSGQTTADKLAALNALTNVANSGGSNLPGATVAGAVTSLLKPLAIGLTLVLIAPKLLDTVGKRL